MCELVEVPRSSFYAFVNYQPPARATADEVLLETIREIYRRSRNTYGVPRMVGQLNASLGYGDLLVLTWFVASAATVGGGLGSGLESDEAIRAAAYSKREEERRSRLARERAK